MRRIGGAWVITNRSGEKWRLTEGGMCGHAAMDDRLSSGLRAKKILVCYCLSTFMRYPRT